MNKTTQATVRILISHDYCHFEVNKVIEGLVDEHGTAMHLTNKEIDDARKDCQRLADKAVGQYKKAKSEAITRTSTSSERINLEREVAEINKRDQQTWSFLDKAKVKALADYNHESYYNYMDDEEYEIGNE